MRTPILLAVLLAAAPVALLGQGPTSSSADAPAVGFRLPDYGSVAQVTRNHLYDKWQFDVSAAMLIVGSTVRIDPDSGTGTEIDLEDDLGLNRTVARPLLAARWRPGHRHEIEVAWVFVNRHGDQTLADTIVVGDTSFSAGARLQSGIRSDQLNLTYRWAFHASETSEVGLGVGLGAQILSLKLDALAGAASGGDTARVEKSYKKNLVGPRPSLGLYGRWRLGERWNIEADARGIYAKISTVTIWDVEAGAGARYWFSNTWGLEAGYTLGLYDMKVDVANSGSVIQYDFAGKFQYSNQKLYLGVNVAP
jgi:hypothetical protein